MLAGAADGERFYGGTDGECSEKQETGEETRELARDAGDSLIHDFEVRDPGQSVVQNSESNPSENRAEHRA